MIKPCQFSYGFERITNLIKIKSHTCQHIWKTMQDFEVGLKPPLLSLNIADPPSFSRSSMLWYIVLIHDIPNTVNRN